MGALGACVRADLRRHWRAMVVLVLLLGIGGGMALATGAGARRTESAYPRFLAAHSPRDERAALVFGDPSTFATVADHPAVDAVATFMNYLVFEGRTGDGRFIGGTAYVALGSTAEADPTPFLGTTKLLSGRRADPNEVGEVMASFTVAEHYDLGPGDTLELVLADAEALETFDGLGVPEGGESVVLTVVGVEAIPHELPPRSTGEGAGTVTATPAFHERYADRYGEFPLLIVRFVEGTEMEAVRPDLEALGLQVYTAADSDGVDDATQRAIRVQALGMWSMATLIGVAALLVTVQAMSRQLHQERLDDPVLRALGLTRWQRARQRALRYGVVCLCAGALAGIIAVGASPLFPVGGLARIAEPNPGVRVDRIVVAVGASSLAVIGLLSVVLTEAFGARGRARPLLARSRTSDALAGVGVGPVPVVGVHLALAPGGGTRSLPVRSTVLGAAIAVGAVAAALTVQASLGHLVQTPRLFGYSWDLTWGDGWGPDTYDHAAPVLAHDERVAAFSSGTITQVRVSAAGGLQSETSALAVSPERGSIEPVLLAGTAPAGPDEIALAPRTMRSLGAAIGDRVTMTAAPIEQPLGDPVEMTIVGRVVVPAVSGVGTARQGDGAVLTYEGLSRSTELPRNVHLVGLHDPSRVLEFVVDEQVQLFGASVPDVEVIDQEMAHPPPADALNFARVEHLPLVLSGMVSMLAGGMLLHLLASSVRRRRMELGVLRALGLVRRQVAAVVAWQATAVVLAGALLGLPLGTVVGRLAWTALAEDLGVVVEPVVPGWVVCVPLAALAAAVAFAALPARRASRISPAAALWAE